MSTARTIATLAGLTALLPLNAALVLGALAVGTVMTRRQPATADKKTVLVSGGKMTKALQLARSFHAAGHRVVLVDSHRYWLTGHRFSCAVDRFYTVPAPDAPDYADALLAIVKREQVDTYVPVCSPKASLYDSLAMRSLSSHCEVLHVAPDMIEKLDDKYQFARSAEALDLQTPESVLITDPEQVGSFDFASRARPFILKSIRYDSVRRLDLTRLPLATPAETEAYARSLPITPDNPWVMQEFIPGTEYCTHGTMRSGSLRAYCCCVSSAFQVNYEHIDRPAIEEWVRRFSAGLGFTGQASFDFIDAADGSGLYAIECNPRTHSAITMFYDHPGLAEAYLFDAPLSEPVRPLATSLPTYWLYHEIWRIVAHITDWPVVRERLRVIRQGKEAVFDWRDPLPFLMLYHWHIPVLLLRDLKERRGWLRIDFNIGKLVQSGGD